MTKQFFIRVHPCSSVVKVLFFFWISASAVASTYHVGPKEKLSALKQVPWESLKPGDEVLIEWKPEPYKEKFVIGVSGKENRPIAIRGVPGPKGELPVIAGDGATTRSKLSYWGDVRGVVKIGGARMPSSRGAGWIVLENLDIRGARPPYSFITSDGKTKKFNANAAALYVEKVQHLIVRNCALHDSGNGLFISSNNESASRDILVEHCDIFDNGNAGSGQEHNVYTEAMGIIFQFNHFGKLRSGCGGNNLKDRSSGLVVRYNWIEGGDKELDLVDAEDSAIIRNHPDYKKTFVYGNVIIKPAGHTHSQIVHFGGDSADGNNYRHGTLYFYHNTVISYFKGETALFWPADEKENFDCRNNIIYLASEPGKSLRLLSAKANLQISHNWFKEGIRLDESKLPLADDHTSVIGKTPGFVNEAEGDFHLSHDSPCRNAAGPLGELKKLHDVTNEYVHAQHSYARKTNNDIGAFEFAK